MYAMDDYKHHIPIVMRMKCVPLIFESIASDTVIFSLMFGIPSVNSRAKFWIYWRSPLFMLKISVVVFLIAPITETKECDISEGQTSVNY